VQDKELYQHLLGLCSPWTVANVALDIEAQEIVVSVEHPRSTKFCCPDCQLELPCHDHAEERRWRHLDSCQFKTILSAQTPRVKCPEHGVRNVMVPWAQKNSRFTTLFERFAIDVVLATQTVTGAMKILRTTWDQTWQIVKRAVARGQARKEERPIPHLGIDEKAFAKGQSYLTLIVDLDRSTVEAISEGNDVEGAKACFSQLSRAQIASVEAIAMDMSAAYVRAALEMIPLAETKIVHDRFHIMQHATKAVDLVRRREHRRLQGEGDDRLKGTKYLWLTSSENLTERQQQRFDASFSVELLTGKAWGYKEMLRDLWHNGTAEAATTYFQDWYRRVIHTKLEPMKKVARMIKERLTNVVSYCTHKITNGVAEGINSKIMAIKRRVGGFRNVENYKTAIYFYCGGLDLHPR
jgi:transposase